MRHYETVLILNPELGEDAYAEKLKKFGGFIEKEKGIVIKIDEWGSQNLAYPVKKFERGFYVRMEYCGEPGLVSRLERETKIDDAVLKYMTVKLANKVDPEELLRKERQKAEKERPAPEETTETAEREAAVEERPESPQEVSNHD